MKAYMIGVFEFEYPYTQIFWARSDEAALMTARQLFGSRPVSIKRYPLKDLR